MATDTITRRQFLKAAGITLGVAGTAIVLPPSWRLGDNLLAKPAFAGERLLGDLEAGNDVADALTFRIDTTALDELEELEDEATGS